MKIYESNYYVDNLCDIEEDVFDSINHLLEVDEEKRDDITKNFNNGNGHYKVTVEYESDI